MKKIYLFLLVVFGYTAYGQQKGISYQAVIINPNGITAPGVNSTYVPLSNKAICLSFQIVNNNNQVEYQESQSVTTDVYGMVNIVIGTGTSGTGLVTKLDAVNWNQGTKKLVVGVNTEGICSNYTEISNQVLNYTPYSFYAQNADIKDGYVTDIKVAMGINPTKVGLGNVNNTSDANKPVSIATQSALDLKENLSNKSSDIATDASPTINYPTVKAVKDYVDANSNTGTIVDANTTTKGKIKLAGDLAGTADVPTVPGLAFKANTTDVTTSLALKEDISNKSNATLGTSTTLYPTQNAVKTYVDTAITGATIVDADTTTKGKIKLAGDLAGTADVPTVPGLVFKANAADVTTALALKANSSSLSTVATSGDYNDLSNKPTIPSAYTLPTSSASVLGGVKVGTNLSIDGSGVLSANLNAGSITGTLSVANGGTGATTLTGIVKGTGTSAFSAAIAGTDYQAPITLTTIGTGAATLTGNTLNIPSVSSTVNANTITGTLPIANGGTGATTKTTAFDALSPMTTAGDIIYGGASGTGTRLAKGTDGQVLQLLNGIPAWQDGLNKNTERVAFGAQAGMTNQGGGAVAIGLAAAEFNQGANAIAIGSSAGNTAQHANSIVLNATGATLNTAIANSLYVAPIRDETAIGNILVYNTTSKEITVAPNFAGGRVTAKGGSTYNDFVGFSFNGGDWAKNTGMFNDAPDDGSSPLKFRIKGISSLEVSPSKVSVLPNTAATSKTTGALTVAGGLGVTGDVYATNLNASGTLTVSSFTIGQGKTPASGDNLAIGRSALNNTTSNGWPNIGLGSFSLNQTTDGKNNVGVGLNALYANTTGSYNIGIGTEAARNASTSSNITAIGMEALKYESGAGNTALGSYAGKPSTSAVYSGTTNSTFLGYNTTTGKTTDTTITNSTAIGYGAAVTASNTIQLGNTSVTNVKTSGALTTGTVTYPNAHNSTAGQVLTVNAAGTASWETPASSSGTAHYVGEVYGGGIVFYITTGGFHGLIAETINSSGMSPADLLDFASDPNQHNTNNGGKLYTDWRVPTFTELKLLYTARNTVGLNLGTLTYQSSTLYYNFVYKALNFNNNTQDNVNGDWIPRITRYIRSF